MMKDTRLEQLLWFILIIILVFAPKEVHSFQIQDKQSILINRCYKSRLYQSSSNQCNNPQTTTEILQMMIRFFAKDMVDPNTHRFYYYCHPQDGVCEHVHMPLRDMAAAWDATKVIRYLKDANLPVVEDLVDAVACTLEFYFNSLKKHQNGGLIPNDDVLLEPVNIGHVALLLLAACNALDLKIIEDQDIQTTINGLSRGILSMQQHDNGAFSTYFGNEDYIRGIAFFPGEAMLALTTAYKFNLVDASVKEEMVTAILNAFEFYSNYHKTGDVDVNYNIWQVMAFSAFYDCLNNQLEDQTKVAQYVLGMCQEICQSTAWKYQLSRGQSFYVNLETVEIACGLDALAEGIRIARLVGDAELTALFERNVRNGVDFLAWMQSHVPVGCAVGSGGLGYGGINVLEQRLDVTGHAISAMVKLHKL